MQDDDTASVFIALMEDEKEFNFGKIFTFFIMAILLGWLLEKAIRKKFSISKEPKYINTSHQRTTYIAKFIQGATLILFNINGWFLYTAAFWIFLTVAIVSNFLIDYYYGREEKKTLCFDRVICTSATNYYIYHLFSIEKEKRKKRDAHVIREHLFLMDD